MLNFKYLAIVLCVCWLCWLATYCMMSNATTCNTLRFDDNRVDICRDYSDIVTIIEKPHYYSIENIKKRNHAHFITNCAAALLLWIILLILMVVGALYYGKHST